MDASFGSHQVLTEYLNAIEVNANKVVIPGSHKPVFSLDSNGNISIDTPLLKVRGEELATKSQLSKLSPPSPKGDKGVSISQIEEYYLASNQKQESSHQRVVGQNHSCFNGYH